MNCDCTEKISSLIDGELSPAETRELERHLLSCVECQEARADFLSLRSQIADFPIAFKPVAQREALTRVLGSLLHGVTPLDPGTFGAVAVLLLAVAALASFIPASRAARVDPVAALRS